MHKNVDRILKEALTSYIAQAKERNPQASLRSVAKSFGLNPATLSLFLNGKRKLSKKLAETLEAKLSLKPDEHSMIEAWLTHSPSSHRDEFPPLPSAQWAHILILAYLQTEVLKKGDLHQQIEFLSDRLKLPVENIESLIEELETAGLLKVSSGGFEVGLLEGNFQEPGHILIRRINAEILSHARKTIEKLDDPEIFAKTDFSSITFPACSDKLDLLKEKIEKFQFEISELMDEKGKNNSVYTLAVQLMEI